MIRKVIFRTVVIWGGICASSIAASQEKNTVLSLKEAIDIARRESPALGQANEGVHQAVNAISLAKSGLLPTLSASADGSRRKDAVIGHNSVLRTNQPYEQYTAGIHLDQPIYSKGLLAAQESAEKDQKISQLNIEISDRALCATVVQAYFQTILSQEAYEILKRQKGILQESLQVTEERKRIGRSQLLDVLQVKSQLSLLESQVIDAKNLVDVAESELSGALGTPTMHYQTRAKFDIPDHATALASSKTPEIRVPEIEQNRLKILQIEDQRSITWGKSTPNLALFGDYNLQSTRLSQLDNENGETWDIGVALNVPIFSGFSSFDQDAGLDSQKRQLEYAGKALENQQSQLLAVSLKQLENAHTNVNAGIEALKIAQQTSAEATRQYRLATIDFLQFLSIHSSLLQAEQSLSAAKFNYIMALNNYYQAVGQDVEKLIQVVDGSSR